MACGLNDNVFSYGHCQDEGSYYHKEIPDHQQHAVDDFTDLVEKSQLAHLQPCTCVCCRPTEKVKQPHTRHMERTHSPKSRKRVRRGYTCPLAPCLARCSNCSKTAAKVQGLVGRRRLSRRVEADGQYRRPPHSTHLARADDSDLYL